MPKTALRADTTGERVIEAIENAGYNLHQFSQLGGLSYQTLQNWKTGKWKPSLDKLAFVSLHTGYTTDEMMGNEEPSSERIPCRYTAWVDFEQTSIYANAPEQTLRQAARWVWEPGYEPTVDDYIVMVSTLGRRAKKG